MYRGDTTRSGRPGQPWWLPSLADVSFLIPLLLLFSRLDGIPGLLGDGDTGWHIRTGEWILDNGAVPRQDIFSYTRPGEPWFAWEWLWDVGFALLFRAGGLALVALASLAVIGLTFLLVYRLSLRVSGSFAASIATTILAIICSSVHWLARPHLFTLLFSVLFLWILLDARQGNQNRLWILPLLMVLWTNLHGGFIAGIVIAGAFVAGELAGLSLRWIRGESGLPWTQVKPFAFVTGACAMVTLLNPYGWALHRHIYTYLTESFHARVVDEMQSLDFHHPGALYFELMLLLGVSSALWHLARFRFTEPALILLWMHGALYASRNLPIYAVVASPFIATVLADWCTRLSETSWRVPVRQLSAWLGERGRTFAALESNFRAPLLGIALLVVVALAVLNPEAKGKFRAEFDPGRYPAAALAALEHHSASRIFTHDEWGDYLIFRLFPATRVFVDGRSDFYGPRFCERYLDVMRVRANWEETLREYEVDTVLLPVKTALTGALKQSARWKPVFDDGKAIVFRKQSEPSGALQAVTDSGGATRPDASQPEREGKKQT